MGFPLTWPLVKAIFIAKVDTVHTVDACLRDRHTGGFSPYMAQTRLLVIASFIAKVDTVHTVDAGLRDRHTEGFSPYKAFSNRKFYSLSSHS